MILSAQAPLEPFGRPLRGLYVALNSPVVTIESLPPGPARAAVALHEAGATLCLRSVRTGQVRIFTTTEELAAERRVALDAALSFAESMGFLFDEDEVVERGDVGPEEAALLWQDHCGEPVDASHGPDQEILLEEPLPELEDEEACPPQLPPAHVLSKFRRVGALESGAERPSPPDVRLRLVSRF